MFASASVAPICSAPGPSPLANWKGVLNQPLGDTASADPFLAHGIAVISTDSGRLVTGK
jgi:hypothetical protein